ncbi:hypothetical protein R1sor_012952 [Riccia sorocarpa]|uniref:Uncharacterized protein n=1 Tax=Riccia sorocarpa TaxID=122646 RepID=A0ABD3I9A4_9MARC
MAPKKRPPQAPPAEAPGRKKRTQETTQQATDAGPSVRHTRQQAAGAWPSVQPVGPSVQPVGPSVPTSRQKKAAKRPRGEPKKPLNPDAIEGEYLVKFEHIADRERHVRWCYVTGDQRHSALRAVRNRDLTASGLSAALDLPVHRPHGHFCHIISIFRTDLFVSRVYPFRGYCDPREGVSPLDLPMEATVRGRTVRLDAALVCAAFVLPAASLEIKRQVRHSLIVDWFREYERNGKRYIARTCLHREWAPALECICMVLLASRRPRCIHGRLVYYIKKFKMDPEDDPEDRFDFAELMVQSLRREVLAVRGHLTADTPERYMDTFVAVPLTWIFIHLGIITGEECDAPPAAPAAPADPTGPSEQPVTRGLGLREVEMQRAHLIAEITRLEERRAELAGDIVELRNRAGLAPRVISPLEPRAKILILEPQGFFYRMANKKGVEAALKNGFEVLSCLEKSLVVRPGDCLVALLELLQKRCHIIVWSRASLKYVTAFLGLMVSNGYLPAFMLDPQVCTLWGGDGVETVHPRRDLEDSAKLKSFRRLYEHGICLR